MSAKVPDRMEEGAAPKKPCKNRRMKMVVALLASMTGSCARMKAMNAPVNGPRLPKHSLRGL